MQQVTSYKRKGKDANTRQRAMPHVLPVILAALTFACMVGSARALDAAPYSSGREVCSFSESYMTGPYYEALMDAELTGDLRKDLLAVAASQVGYAESDSASQLDGTRPGTGNYSEYGRYLGSNGRAWCSEFASWCARMAGVPEQILSSSRSASASSFGAPSLRWSDTMYANGSYVPRPGDLVLFAWDGTSPDAQILSHTAILLDMAESEDSVRLTLIEGNSRNAVRKATCTVDKADGWMGRGYVATIITPKYERDMHEDAVPTISCSLSENRWAFSVANLDIDAGDAVYYAIWSEENGQDDLVWYEALQAGSAWTVEVIPARHPGRGKVYAHVYSGALDGALKLQAGDVVLPPGERAPLVLRVQLGTGSTSRILLENAGDFGRVQFPVWSEAGGQDDIAWYDATHQDNGTWTADVDTRLHGGGHMIVHAYADGRMLCDASFAAPVSVRPAVSVQGLGGTRVQVIVSGLPNAASVLVPTWSEEGGQDDIVWYEAVHVGDGTWVAQIDCASHGIGDIVSHAYADSRFIGAARARVPDASGKVMRRPVGAVRGVSVQAPQHSGLVRGQTCALQ